MPPKFYSVNGRPQRRQAVCQPIDPNASPRVDEPETHGFVDR